MRRAAVSIMALGTMASAVIAMSGAPAQASSHAHASSRIVIREIYYNSPGSDHGSNSSLNHEWVELHNRTGQRIALTHWTLRDKQGHVYRFGTYRLKAHGYVKIHTGKGRDTRADLHWRHSWYIWNNTGDRATLKNAGGSVIARCSYSDPHEEHSFKVC